MGAGTSILNSHENEITLRELAKPLDASDLTNPDPDGVIVSSAKSEVVRIRLQLAQLMDKGDFQARKNENKWRRGSFGQIKKADDFWEKAEERERVHRASWAKKNGAGSRRGSRSGTGPGDFEDLNVDNIAEELMKMTADFEVLLDSPRPGENAAKEKQQPKVEVKTCADQGVSSKGKKIPGRKSLGERLKDKEGGKERSEKEKDPSEYKPRTQRRSFVLEKGIELLESDSDGEA